jgi:hypothetical protein
MEIFLVGMGGTSVFKLRSFSLVVEFVPVSFDPELSRAFNTIEDASGLGRNQLMQVQFIKPIARCQPGQASVHVIFGF